MKGKATSERALGAPQIKGIAKVTNESVLKHTGRGWDEWVAILEKAGARAMNHSEMVRFLLKKYKLGPWWQQQVSMGFEIFAGLRIAGQNLKGKYTLVVTRSLTWNHRELWKTLMSPNGIEIWLRPLYPTPVEVHGHFETRDGYFGEFRTMKAEHRLRMTWQDPNWPRATVVQISVVNRKQGNSILVFGQEQIPDLKTKKLLRERWESVAAEWEKVFPDSRR